MTKTQQVLESENLSTVFNQLSETFGIISVHLRHAPGLRRNQQQFFCESDLKAIDKAIRTLRSSALLIEEIYNS